MDLEAPQTLQVPTTKNKELVLKFQSEANRHYTRFYSQRRMNEILWKVSDYMYKAAQNRSITKYEQQKGANLEDFWENPASEIAQSGSTLFHRQVRQLAAQGASVQFSRDVPFKYEPIINDDNPETFEKGDEMANQLNVLAKWTMKHDKFNKKSIEFWHQIFKMGNIPVMAEQIVKKGVRKVREPIIEPVQNPVTGEITANVTGYNEYDQEFIVKNYPSIRILPVETVYADMYIGSIQAQNCVVVPSLKNYSELLEGARAGYYDQDAVLSLAGGELWGKYRWDGVSGEPLTRFKLANNEVLAGDSYTGQFLVWDVFMRSPIMAETWDVKNAPEIWWGTFVGNQITNSLCLRLEENSDPDHEFPIEMIHCLPDDPDILYHTSPAQIVRSNYSVECTLKNQAIDNCTLVNRPPLKVVEGQVIGKNFEFTPGKIFKVEAQGAIEEFMVRDTTQITTNFLNYIRDDTMSALATDKPFMGESFGARTSATEASNTYKNSVQPHMISIRYILEQYLGFYAKKLKSYWQAFSDPTQVIRITGEQPFSVIRPAQIYGEFDVEVDIVDEFEDDVVESQKINEAIRMVGQNPAFMQVIDVSELMRAWFRRYKFDYGKIVTGRMDKDAEVVARNENVAMLGGMYIRPQPNQNHGVHLSEHKGERLRYNGLEEQKPQVALLDQHIAETEFLVQQQEAAASQAQAQQQGQSGNTTPGQVQGNQAAAALGSTMGG